MNLRCLLRWSSIATTVFALACLGWFAFYQMDALIYEQWQTALIQEPAKDASTVPETRPTPTVTWGADPKLIGRVEIPRLGVSGLIRMGLDAQTLRRAVGHVPKTARPGEKGNVVLAAHRQQQFRGLRDVRQGDRILVTTSRGGFEYEVERIWVVDPHEISVMDATPGRQITLLTCYPFDYVGPAPQRLVVRGRQVLPL
jgi:LPXTG-site transpeptidase (sortase) family protein